MDVRRRRCLDRATGLDAYGVNATFVTYRLLKGSCSIDLEVTPLVTYRSFHALASGQGWNIGVEQQDGGAMIRAYDQAAPFWLRSDRAEFRPGGAWWWGFRYRGEAERGLVDRGDLFAPGVFLARLAPGETVTLVYSTEVEIDLDAASSRAAAEERQRSLLVQAGAQEADPIVQQLVLAADQFLVARPLAGRPGRPQCDRRLPLVQRLGPRHHDQLARADPHHRPGGGGRVDLAHLRPLRRQRPVAQQFP